jgi:MFS family permease
MTVGARPIATAVAAVVAGVIPMFLTAALLPRIGADFRFGKVGLGVGVAGFHATSALAAPRFGHLVERWGAARCVEITAGIAALCSLAIAVGARSATAMVVLLTLAGLANGASGPAASALLSRTVPTRRRGLAFGAQQAGAPLAALLAGMAAWLVAGPLGWRSAFALAALTALLAAAIVPRQPLRAGPPAARRVRPQVGQSLRALVLAAALASATSTGMMAFLVTYAVDSGVSEQGAGVLLGVVSCVAMASRIGLGLAVDRWDGDALAIASGLLVASAVGCLVLTAATPALIAVGALTVGGLGWAWTGLFTLAVVKQHPDAPGRAVGVMMSGLFAGAVAGPLLVGVLARHGAYARGWVACAALAALAAATVAATRRKRRPYGATLPTVPRPAHVGMPGVAATAVYQGSPAAAGSTIA